MSDTDSFIDEVTEEVRRDRLFALARKYGWIAVLIIVLIVGGAAWNEYTKSRDQAAAQALGDAITVAMEAGDAKARAEALAAIETDEPGGTAVVDFLRAAALAEDDRAEEAGKLLDTISLNGDLPLIYRNIAAFKALTLRAATADPAELRTGFSALATPGSPLRLLAEEQLAIIDIRTGETDAAIDRLQAILEDAEVTADLQQRATQVIVALGGDPQAIPGATGAGDDGSQG
ncbi:hypothetical protein [Marinibacterium profundimaris]|uniref:Tetratricopeptide repeat-like domain-containing protein n=1 Tax=Marinibacterium profundimaris TaxID=1679460 RepID=A0A225NUQ3_9RHOB|nr:hypothetical protein [Marinibacterium profundimaris]OWU77237.1 hypothetical protein ATO3_00375 [Marinibacterium profundimaris]